MNPFYIRRGDRRPLVVTLTPDTNVNGASVVFSMRVRDGATVISNRPMTIEQPSPARVRMDFQPGETDAVDVYGFVVKVTFSDGRQVSYPTESLWPLIIVDNLP